MVPLSNVGVACHLCKICDMLLFLCTLAWGWMHLMMKGIWEPCRKDKTIRNCHHLKQLYFMCTSLNDSVCKPTNIISKYFHDAQIDNKVALAKVMAWRRTDIKLLHEAVTTALFNIIMLILLSDMCLLGAWHRQSLTGASSGTLLTMFDSIKYGQLMG